MKFGPDIHAPLGMSGNDFDAPLFIYRHHQVNIMSAFCLILWFMTQYPHHHQPEPKCYECAALNHWFNGGAEVYFQMWRVSTLPLSFSLNRITFGVIVVT